MLSELERLRSSYSYPHRSAFRRRAKSRVSETAQQFVATVMMDNRFSDNRAEAGHSVGEPLGNLSSVQR
jgi:hypothetical protein